MNVKDRLKFAVDHKVINWELINEALKEIDELEEGLYELKLECEIYKTKMKNMKKRNDMNDTRSGN